VRCRLDLFAIQQPASIVARRGYARPATISGWLSAASAKHDELAQKVGELTLWKSRRRRTFAGRGMAHISPTPSSARSSASGTIRIMFEGAFYSYGVRRGYALWALTMVQDSAAASGSPFGARLDARSSAVSPIIVALWGSFSLSRRCRSARRNPFALALFGISNNC